MAQEEEEEEQQRLGVAVGPSVGVVEAQEELRVAEDCKCLALVVL